MLSYSISKPIYQDVVISKPLPDDIAERVLLNCTCHVDHEGFDLNEIEQAYYKHNNVSLEHDTTWYKDGDATRGAHAIIQPWLTQNKDSELILDHSQFVFRYPLSGDAAAQVKAYAKQRPELLRILSTEFKCGLDLCIDYISADRVQPVVHIEWDYISISNMIVDVDYVETALQYANWQEIVSVVKRFNMLSKNSLDAFQQADFRSMLLFGRKSYTLIPTL
tara:strand:- start:539 stop:1201 length:663 start_codon:yes stop_codon:yes gene_type:complete